jgi:hypothetical protein
MLRHKYHNWRNCKEKPGPDPDIDAIDRYSAEHWGRHVAPRITMATSGEHE